MKENVIEQTILVQKLVGETPEVSAKYGESVSISDNKIVVGAPGDASVSD